MASKRRIRRKACSNKKTYETQQAATSAMISAKKRGVVTGSLNVYRCKWGGKYHWGHRRHSRRLSR